MAAISSLNKRVTKNSCKKKRINHKLSGFFLGKIRGGTRGAALN